ncbi:ATP-binding cassette domain-containing protein [Caballeronia sp. LjRoot34]|uniref:ABC transporter ATP-binding protein n=1 Tax=Caballeronia sp. LjRoot34 TaxID=3342325 RepID=UPI003ECF438E
MSNLDLTDKAPILSIRNASKVFRRRNGELFHAVKDATVSVYPGETVALVGESGSGKSTLARIALSLLRPDSGEVFLEGRSLTRMSNDELRKWRIAMQPVFQDSSAAFNPRRTVIQSLAQACSMIGVPASEHRDMVIQLLETVRLSPGEQYLNRFPHELSGGQRQRLSIARALATNPKVIIADEPLSGADVSIRGQILNVLVDMQQQRGMSYLFVTHDISIARAFAHRVVVMYKGEVVEQGDAKQVIDSPQHPYTKRLVDATITLDAKGQPARPHGSAVVEGSGVGGMGFAFE